VNLYLIWKAILLRFLMKHKLTSWAVLAAILIIPVPTFAAAAPVHLNIGTASVTSSALSLWIAQEQGIFKKHDMETRTILLRGGPILVGSLVAGDIDLAFTTGVPILGAATQGTEIKMLTTTTNRLSWKLMANPRIRKAEDLRGKRIGVQSVVGSTWMNSMLALEALGLEPKRDNISFLPTGDPVTMSQALEVGRIDAAVLDPALSRSLMSKGFSLVVDLAQANVFFPGLGFGATQAYIDQHGTVVEKLVTALIESIAFVLAPANKPTVLKSLMKNLRLREPALAEEGYQDQMLLLIRKPYPSLEGLRTAQRLMGTQNTKIAALKIEDLVDPRFVQRLDKSGFIDRLYAPQK
jgi:ABC-type nitrate/sulfonate/bicarbonate transport system substrate-binding protein